MAFNGAYWGDVVESFQTAQNFQNSKQAQLLTRAWRYPCGRRKSDENTGTVKHRYSATVCLPQFVTVCRGKEAANGNPVPHEVPVYTLLWARRSAGFALLHRVALGFVLGLWDYSFLHFILPSISHYLNPILFSSHVYCIKVTSFIHLHIPYFPIFLS
jgi:hypothetical protein